MARGREPGRARSAAAGRVLLAAGRVSALLGLALVGAACSDADARPVCPAECLEPPSGPTALYGERWRPQVHYSPPYGWMNDPNGLVHVDGTWHLFYQHNPLGDGFGFLSWGHALGPDLTRWKPTNLAIPFEGRVAIFSGGAVLDSRNTSGLCETSAADRGECVVAIYTANVVTDTGNVQHQNLAVSQDGGRTFRRFEGNPVLDVGSGEFRDPKVFWHAPTERWIQVVALPVDHRVAIYRSTNLRDWEWASDFGPAGATGGVWECPDLFPLPVPDEQGASRWVMKVDLNPGAVAGGSGGQYFLGDFDGTRFTPTEGQSLPRWVDWGPDFYCATTWSDAPFDARHWIGWMSNWRYAGELPTHPWRGQMTLPRRVELARDAEGRLALSQTTEPSLARLRGAPSRGAGAGVADALRRASRVGSWEATLDVGLEGATEPVVLRFTQRGGPPYAILRVRPSGSLELSRPAGANAVVAGFAGDFSAPLALRGGATQLHLVVDRSSIEVFGPDGRAVITMLVLPRETPTGVEVEAPTAATTSVTAWPLRSIWR